MNIKQPPLLCNSLIFFSAVLVTFASLGRREMQLRFHRVHIKGHARSEMIFGDCDWH